MLSLTTRSWHDGVIEIPAERWIRGGTPKPSTIAPWAVQSIGAIEFWQGRLESDLVSVAIEGLVDELPT